MSYSTRVICTDGSTVLSEFPYEKRDLFLVNDLKNVISYVSPMKRAQFENKNKKVKKNHLNFGFHSLLDKKDEAET